mgnify:CR=1 FL=1
MEKNGSAGSPHRRSVGATVFAWLILVPNSILILICLLVFINSVLNPQSILDSFRRVEVYRGEIHNINSIRELYFFMLEGLILWVPSFVGAIAVLRLKEWGRKLIIVVSLVSFIYFSYRLIMHTVTFEVTAGMSLIFYVLIIYYFTRPKVKEQFK